MRISILYGLSSATLSAHPSLGTPDSPVIYYLPGSPCWACSLRTRCSFSLEIALTWQSPSVFQPSEGLDDHSGGAECSGSSCLGPCRLTAGQVHVCISLLGGRITGCFSDKLLTVRASMSGIRTFTRDLWSA